MKKNPVVAMTGHRPDKLGGYDVPNPVFEAVSAAIDKSLIEINPETVYCGMALGVDQWTAELCVFNEIPFIAAVPFINFDSKWPPSARQRLQDLCKLASSVHVVTQTTTYSPHLLQARNEYMVRNADVVLAVWNGSPGGTANCVKFARSINKEVVLVNIEPEIWEAAAEEEEYIKTKRATRAIDNVQAVAFLNSAVAQAAAEIISPEILFNKPAVEEYNFAKRRATEDVRRVDALKPRRLIEMP